METGKLSQDAHYACREIAAERDRLRAENERMKQLLTLVWNFPSHPGGHPGDRSEDAMCEDDWRHGWICAVSEMHEALRGEGE